MRIYFLLLVSISLISFQGTNTLVQNTNLNASDSTFLDFWIGEWNVYWFEQNNFKAGGKNSINYTMNGKVIEENFEIYTGASAGFKGSSWSVFDANKNKWMQTWVDSQGAYMCFESDTVNGNRVFKRSITKNDQVIEQRMMFLDVQSDKFTWNWESSTDGGLNWTLNWQIFYERVK